MIEGLPNTKEEALTHLKELDKPLEIDDLKKILGSTIKHDDENKALTFLTMLLTYTEEDQINIGFIAESSTGKSYIPLELSWYFPKEDLIKLGYASPQTFFYETGILIPDPNDTRDIEEEKKRKIRIVDLHQKILIFMDQPHDQLLQRLRSLLSHDENEITSKLVNRREKSGNRTETVIIRGYPTFIFCSAKFNMHDQEKSRLLLLSPEINEEKLRETIAMKIDKESDREVFYKRTLEDPQRKLLAFRVEAIKRAKIKHVIIQEELREHILRNFMEAHKHLIPRHQRDISRLLAIVKGHALLNYMHREKKEDSILVTIKDVEAGFRLYGSVSEANEIGLPPEIFNIYQKLKPQMEDCTNDNGFIRKDFQKYYFKEFHKVIGQKTAKELLDTLTNVGLLIEQPDPTDRRFLRYIPSDMGVTSRSSNSAILIQKSLDKEYPPSAGVYSFRDSEEAH